MVQFRSAANRHLAELRLVERDICVGRRSSRYECSCLSSKGGCKPVMQVHLGCKRDSNEELELLVPFGFDDSYLMGKLSKGI